MIIFFIFLTLEVKENTPSDIYIEYAPENVKITNLGGYKYISFQGASCDSLSGMPVLPYKVIKVFFPVDGDIKISASYDGLQIIKGEPLPLSDIYGRRTKGKDYYAYHSSLIASQKFNLFGTKYAQISIYPFAFTSRGIIYRKRIFVKIKFTGKDWGWIPENLNTSALNFLNFERIKQENIKKNLKAGKSFNENWLKINIIKSGIYKITYNDLKISGVLPEEIDPYSIALYNGGSHILSWDEDAVENIPDSIPYRVATDFYGNNNHIFEQGEYLLFYGNSLEGFSKNTQNGLSFYYNPFTDTNVYWLTWGGEALQMETKTAESGTIKKSFKDTIHIEKDLLCPAGSGLGWIWKYMSAEEQDTIYTIPIQIHNPVNNTGEIRLSLYFPDYKQHYVKLLSANDSADFIFSYSSVDTPIILDTTLNLTGGWLKIILSGQDRCFFDWAEVIYDRQIDLNSGDIDFTVSPAETVKVSLPRESVIPYVYDINNPFIPEKIGIFKDNDSIKFSVNGSARVYIAKNTMNPISIKYLSPFNLRTGGADYIIITHPLIKRCAEMLAVWREKHLKGYANPVINVVSIDDIYNNFSFGIKDPTAIKRFIYYASVNYTPSPSFILLFGRGTYDSKNHFGYENPTDLIPLHSEGANVNFYGLLSANANWDDWYVDFDGNRKPDIPIGRINVDNEYDARNFVEKIEKWELSSGIWRTKAILVADMETTSATDMEDVSNNLPKWMIQNKVYLIFSVSTQIDKIDMRERLIKLLNEGALFAIYYGHGNSMQLARENVLRNADLLKINNLYKMPFFYFGSCNVGYYDRPDYRCMADEMVRNKNGGNIASLAATRATSSGGNSNLGENIAQKLFQYNTIGELVTAAKNVPSYSSNTYTFFGDPGTPFLSDTLDITITSDDSIIGGRIFSLKGLSAKTPISGEFLIREKDRDTTYQSNIIKLPPSYPLYKGKIETLEDTFTFHFIPPYNIISDTSYIYGYIHHRTDVSIFYKPLLSGIDDSTIISDTLTFRFLINGRELKNGDPVKESGNIGIEIGSRTGVDLRNQRNILIYINDPYHQSGIGVSDRFKYYTNSYKKGILWVDYGVQPEDNSLIMEVQVKTNAKEWGKAAIHLKVKRRGKFIESVYNYPNPFSHNTTFIITLDDDGDGKLLIYTSTGKLVRKFDFYGHYGNNYIKWDGRDEFHNIIPPGLYIYKITFTGNSSYNKESKFGKILHIPK